MLPNPLKTCFVIGLLLCTWQAHAQKENLARDFSFFQNKSREFSAWLDKTGLGKSLAFDLVQMRPLSIGDGIDSTELELVLLIRTNDPDSAIGIWQGLKKGFDSPDDSLENILYRTFIHQMEIPGQQGSIQVCIRDKKRDYNRCFYIYIWQEADEALGTKIKSEYHFKECKSRTFEITVTPPPVKIRGKGKTTKIIKPKIPAANQVFEVIRRYAIDSVLHQPRYRTGNCTDRSPRFETDSLRTSNAFRFTLADLGQEVIPPYTLLGFTTIAMERLTYQFEYYPIQGGFTLKCIIEGKYGSGFFKPRVSGYMNMEPDYNDYLEAYSNKVRRDIQKRL